MSGMLSCVEALWLHAVLEDCSHQLAILGNIMPPRSRGPSQADEDHMMDHMDKIHRDREFAVSVVDGLLVELKERQTVRCLLEAVEAEDKRKALIQQVISREEEQEMKIDTLQKELLDIRRETQLELQEREELIADLKHRVLEMNEKTSVENSYVCSSTQQQIHQTQKLNSHNEKSLGEEIKLTHMLMEEAQRVHQKTHSFLQEKLKVREKELEEVKEHYKKRLAEKEGEVHAMRSSRASNQTALQETARKCREMERVVMEDRVEKEHLHVRLEREKLERSTATKIQAWWRGCMVRRGLGPFRKRPKAKNGKKTGKKKGKP